MPPQNAVAVNEMIMKELRGFKNVTGEPLYSTLEFGTSGNSAETNFFTGGNTKTDTNVTKAREIPKGHKKIVTAIRIAVMPDVTPADLKEILKDAILVFAPNEDARLRHIPVVELGAGGGASGFFTQASAADDNLVNNGTPQDNSKGKLARPEVIRGDVPFVCQILHPAAITPAAATRVSVILDGPYAYPAAAAAS